MNSEQKPAKSRDHERRKMIKELEAREAGVAELAALYERIEAVYVEASLTVATDPPTTISNSANPVR